ncbi:hypothetical protein ACFL3T_01420 [Patescibacteria group bacterium]
MKKLISILVVGVFLFGFAGCEPEVEDPRLAEIAQCLTDSGAKMYGAVWCSHCNAQKKRFGKAWERINYIECDARTDKEGAIKCLEAEIEGFPTWEFADGERLAGNQNPDVLAEKAGCELGINN